MKAATRSRWLELTRRRRAARRGHQLLEEKREVLLAAVASARRRRDAAREEASAALDASRDALVAVEIELGSGAVASAAIAQASAGGVGFERRSLLGVPLARLSGTTLPFRLDFAPGGTSESLDRAARSWAAALPLVLRLAREEVALRGLLAGLARTNRRCNALEHVVLPGLDREIASIDATLEEESRDEAVRMRRRSGPRRVPREGLISLHLAGTEGRS